MAVEGRIKCVAVVTHPTNTTADVTTYMQDTLDELATARAQSKLAPDFQQGTLVVASKMKVNERTAGGWQLYPKITYAGELKQNKVESEVIQDAVDDLATWWQNDLVNRGYTIVSWYVKNYTGA